MTNKNLESLSALLDSEISEQELQENWQELSDDSTQVDTFGRYSLIGDVLRNEQELMTSSSFADGIQAAIADVELDKVQAETSDSVVSIASHPKWHQKIAAKVKALGQTSTGKGLGQMAIAASVALVAVVGVNNMQVEEQHMPSPVLSTQPLVSGLEPVSVENGLAPKPTANQVTQSRINALMADHNQQLRVADGKDEENSDEEEKKIDN
jgi:sigma-E factor negative regulatory protein RseA